MLEFLIALLISSFSLTGYATHVVGCGTPDANCDAILGAPDAISVAQCREFGKWVRVGFDGAQSSAATFMVTKTEYDLTSAALITYYDINGEPMGTFSVRVEKGSITTPKLRGMWENVMIEADSLYCYWIDAVMTAAPKRVYLPVVMQ